MNESYTRKRIGIVVASLLAVYVAYALGHAVWEPLGAPAAGAVGLAAGVVIHKYWS